MLRKFYKFEINTIICQKTEAVIIREIRYAHFTAPIIKL